jgi:hypothetical protein
MSGRYLTDLATVLRGAGLEVTEDPGWETRARSSGGYADGRPTHLMWHHTASGPGSDGQADVDYCCRGSADKPIANLYLNRAGHWWVMAAGATNTNGKGGPLDGVPADSMNTHALGIEAANLGTGAESWPDAQQSSYMTGARALAAAYGLAHHRAHAEWTSRKIDPAGPSRWATGSATWNMDALRADLAAGWPGTSPEPTPPKRRPKMYVLLKDEDGVCWATDNMAVRYLYNATLIQSFTGMLAVFGYGTEPTMVRRADVLAGNWGIVTGSVPAGAAAPTTYVDGWGATIGPAAGQPAGRVDLVLQEIRAGVKGS